jgi:hypothetical protein
MSHIIETVLTTKLAAWLDQTRPNGFPSAAELPVHVANRDELRTRPCLVLATSEAKPVSGMPNTARINLDIHLFSQVDDTPIHEHVAWAMLLNTLLANVTGQRDSLNSESFVLHDLILRSSSTTPDESRGRETVLNYEAVVSAL